jgi:endonuclease YncB( thermonuclease family)
MFRRRSSEKLTDRQRRLRYAAQRVRWLAIALVVVGAVILGDRLGLFGVRPQEPRSDYERYHGRSFRVARVVDGDTIDVEAPDDGRSYTRVRFWGVDTPETKHPHKPVQHFGPEADRFTRSACDGKAVKLELLAGRTRGTHGRLLAYVILPDGRMLNRELVRQGFGYADPRYDHPHEEEFLRLQGQARGARRGLWRDLTREDLPYYYRETLSLPPAPTQPVGPSR